MNCPEMHLECDDLCEYRRDNKCHSPYWGEPKSVYDLMSNDELIQELRDSIKFKPVSNKEVIDKLHRQEVLIMDLANRLNKHIDASKKVKGGKF